MPDILHRLSIDAPQETVHELIATPDGVAKWWTGHSAGGDAAVAGQLRIHFVTKDRPSAVMEVVECSPEQIVWRCVDGPEEWRETRITFALQSDGNGGTTLLFTHAGWRAQSEFMSGCSTNWGAYLTSLKAGAEGHGFSPFPAGEISRWG